jgi:hypothetical protein
MQLETTGLLVELHTKLQDGSQRLSGCRKNRCADGIDQDLSIDPFFAPDLFDDLSQIDAHCSHVRI